VPEVEEVALREEVLLGELLTVPEREGVPEEVALREGEGDWHRRGGKSSSRSRKVF